MNNNYTNPTMMYGVPNQGMVYNNQYQQPLMTNALSPEQIKELRKNCNQAAIPQVTNLELLKAQCTHRDPQKNCFDTRDNGDGTLTCNICGETFRPVGYDKAQVEEVINDTIDILQTTKLNYLDMSPQAVSEFFKMIPLLKRTPELYQQSMNVFAKYDNGSMFSQQGNGNFFNMFSALTSPNYGMQGGIYGQQPMMMNPQQAAMMQQQQMMAQQQAAMMQQPMMNQQQMMAGGSFNPFYNQPVQQQAVPNQVATPQPQQAAPAKADVKTVLNS